MINFEFRDHYTFEDLLKIVAILRHPGGCPWDGEQTHESLRRCLMEETCEVLEAMPPWRRTRESSPWMRWPTGFARK